MTPKALEVIDVGLIVMLLSIVLTAALIAFQTYVVKHTGSTAIKADSLHYRTDLFVNVAVIIALFLAMDGWGGVDPLFAIAIAAYILHSAVEIVVLAVDELMDKELSDAECTEIKTMVRGFDGVSGMDDLRTRKSGLTCFIQLPLELDGELTLNQAHAISDQVEAKLNER